MMFLRALRPAWNMNTNAALYEQRNWRCVSKIQMNLSFDAHRSGST